MKLYEVLAVEAQLKGQAQATRTDLRATFEKKRHLFEEKRTTFVPSKEGAEQTVEHQSDIQTTVRKELTWIAGIWSKALDASYQVAEGDMAARGDVTLDDGTVLLKAVPATALLELEKRAAEVVELVKAVPTLDPAKAFRADADRGDGVYKARDVQKTRTKKTFVPLVLAQATKEHPAQVKEGYEDLPIGTITEQEWSGLITPAEKGDILERAEEIKRAVVRARQRANDVEIKPISCGAAIFGYVFGNGR